MPSKKVGHVGIPETHPAAQEILAFMGSGAPKGSKLRERFMGEPYGWSQDAVDALLATLFHGSVAYRQCQWRTLAGREIYRSRCHLQHLYSRDGAALQ
jgi:lysozyme family protein